MLTDKELSDPAQAGRSYGTGPGKGVRPKQRIDIERLLWWTYQEKAADKVVDRIVAGLFPSGYGSMMQRCQELARLGVRVDTSTYTASIGDLHPDAETVHDRVCAMGPYGVGVVIAHARAGLQPDWMPGAVPRLVPVLRSNGKPRLMYHDLDKRKPSHCILQLVPDPDHIKFCRQVYMDWWDAMKQLKGELIHLEDFTVTGPAVARMPWLKK